MPRLRQVPRAEAPDGIVPVMYDFMFGDRDPVAEPGLNNGTPGNWWTVVAQSPELMEHCVSGFAFYRSDEARDWVDVDSAEQSARLGMPDDKISNLYRTPAP